MRRLIPCRVFLSLFCAAPVLAGPTIAVLPAARQGALSLDGDQGASQFRAAIMAAYPGVEFRTVNPLTAESLGGCDTVIILAAQAGVVAIAPLSVSEQSALRAFVDGGGGAVLFTDNDTFAGANSGPANASIAGPFGITTAGTGALWESFAAAPPIVPPNPPASPVVSGPFGLCERYSVGWSGWYPGAASVPGARVLATLEQNGQPSLVEFPPRTLAPGAGCAVLFSDSTMVFNGFFTAANRVIALNAIDASLPRCGPADVGSQGGVAGPDRVLDNNDFIVFIDLFFAHSPQADRGATGGVPGSDGQWDNNDFVVFIDQFFGGCSAG